MRTQTKFDGIFEFISRRGRMKLLELLIREMGSKSKVSAALRVSRSTISGWMNDRNRHPSNSSVKRVLDLAWEVDPQETQRILDDELDAFRGELVAFVRRGANNQKSMKN